MAKSKVVVTRNAQELAAALGLSPADGMEIELRVDLNSKIVAAVKERKFTHAQVAKLAKTSRTRVTAMMNYNIQEISTDLMLRILAALGYQAKITIKRIAA